MRIANFQQSIEVQNTAKILKYGNDLNIVSVLVTRSPKCLSDVPEFLSNIDAMFLYFSYIKMLEFDEIFTQRQQFSKFKIPTHPGSVRLPPESARVQYALC